MNTGKKVAADTTTSRVIPGKVTAMAVFLGRRLQHEILASRRRMITTLIRKVPMRTSIAGWLSDDVINTADVEVIIVIDEASLAVLLLGLPGSVVTHLCYRRSLIRTSLAVSLFLSVCVVLKHWNSSDLPSCFSLRQLPSEKNCSVTPGCRLGKEVSERKL